MKVYSVRQVADMLGVTVMTIYKWLWTGELKGYRLGKLWRISEEDLKKFLEQRRETKKGGR